MAKIRSLSMTPIEVVTALSEGNPGAVSVMVKMLSDGAAIDQDSAFGGFGALLALDTEAIYGPRVWMLYKDVCGENLPRTLAVLRAVQLGMLSRESLNRAINNYGDGIDPEALHLQVCERLPAFQKPEVLAEAE